MKKLALVTILMTTITMSCAQSSNNDAFKTIEVDSFQQVLDSCADSCVLVDVRTLDEYNEAHLKGAVLIDVTEDNFKEKALKLLPKNKTIMVYCRSGRRSANAAGILATEGYKVINLEGGISAWKDAGKKIIK